MKIKKVLSILFLVSFFSFVIFIAIDGYLNMMEIEKNGITSIGRYISRKDYPKSSANYFVFYVDGKRIKYNIGNEPSVFYRNLGKFYKIKYLKKYNGSMQPLLDQEVTDTAAILEAGFPIEEVRKRLRNQHK